MTESRKSRSVEGYMCAIAWDHEIGHDVCGTKVYPSIKALTEEHRAVSADSGHCGIVKVRVEFVETIEEGDWS